MPKFTMGLNKKGISASIAESSKAFLRVTSEGQCWGDLSHYCPKTVIKFILVLGPFVVTAVKTVATDGYDAVQVGFGKRAEKNLTRAVRGQMKGGNYIYLKEFRVENTQGNPVYKEGDVIDLSNFKVGDVVTVSGTSKGKGFQGVVKRHGFKGGPRSHGQKHSEHEPGSIGGGGRDGGRVAKGKRMAGRMGGNRIPSKG